MVNFDSGEDLTDKGSGPDMTPMIDMVFLLLVFFLLTSLVIRPVLEVDLPSSDTAVSKEQTELIIEADAEGALSISGESTELEGLEELLVEKMEETGLRTVTIQADKQVEFDLIVQLMDISRHADAESISFVVDKK